MSCGVPQGSILGPLLFLVYINDLSMALNCKLSLYADDSALIYSDTNSDIVTHRLSEELETCKRLLVDNELSLHIGKTEFILFGSRVKLKRALDAQVMCDGIVVKRVETVKYLGMLLDSCLSGNAHVASVIKTCAGRLSFLHRYSRYLDFDSRKILCSALIQPYLDYCISSWYSGISIRFKTRLATFQRKLVRFVHEYDWKHHVDSRNLRDLYWLSIPDRVSYFKMIHLFKIRLGLAPPYLSSGFVSLLRTHSYRTRGSESNYHVSREIALSPTSFTFTAIKTWNGLPIQLKRLDSVQNFKKKLKEFLISHY